MAFAILYSAKEVPRRDFAAGMLTMDICVLAVELLRLRIEAINRAMLG